MRRFWIAAASIALVFGLWYVFVKNGGPEEEIEYNYATIEKGELLRSTSATGVLVPLTTVDVKSKAGGKVVHLAVDEGAVVKKGDLIAMIDPSDTEATYAQASADLQSAQARAEQAKLNFTLQKAASQSAIADARANFEAAKARLATAELQSSRQPALSAAATASAEAAYQSALQDQRRLATVTVPQLRRDATGNLRRAQADLQSAQADSKRQQELLRKGYVSQAAVDRAIATLEGARAAHDTAKQRADTLEADVSAQIKAQDLAVSRAKAALDEAMAVRSDVTISAHNLIEAKQALKSADIALRKALDGLANDAVKRSDIAAAAASTVRSRVSRENAKVQLDSTTVVAPRNGVVTMKYLEEGTIIPPGTSTFAQGTSLVQISDVATMYADCTVDEVDIASLSVGMKVRIILEAYPGDSLDGVVRRVSPAAVTTNNMTTVKVRVEIFRGKSKINLLPGMNATCEFIQMSKQDVVLLPQQAVKREKDRTFVKVKGKDPLKPEIRDVKLGEMGNDSVEVLSGLKPGDEVVTAEINLAEVREVQRKMQEAQQGGGLTGGGPPRRPQNQARPSRGSGGGGR